MMTQSLTKSTLVLSVLGALLAPFILCPHQSSAQEAQPTPVPAPQGAMETATPSDLIQIRSSLDSVERRLADIENSILDEPSKAIELTLLKERVSDVEQECQANLQAMREEVDRFFDFYKWFLGVVVLGILGLAASNLLPDKRKPTTRETPDDTGRGNVQQGLVRADLSGVDLSGVDLSGADLSGANLREANLCRTNLLRTNLNRAYLRGVDLRGARVTEEQLAQAASLRGAIMPDGSRHD